MYVIECIILYVQAQVIADGNIYKVRRYILIILSILIILII